MIGNRFGKKVVNISKQSTEKIFWINIHLTLSFNSIICIQIDLIPHRRTECHYTTNTYQKTSRLLKDDPFNSISTRSPQRSDFQSMCSLLFGRTHHKCKLIILIRHLIFSTWPSSPAVNTAHTHLTSSKLHNRKRTWCQIT